MEFLNVVSEGGGKFTVYSVFISAGGLLALLLVGIIRVLIAETNPIYNFANKYTFVILLVLFFLALLCAVLLAKLCKELPSSLIIFSIAAFFEALCLSYANIIYWLGEFFVKLQELYIPTLMTSPFFVIFSGIQLLVTFIPIFAIIFPFCFEIEKMYNVYPLIASIISNILYIVLICRSELPVYVINCFK